MRESENRLYAGVGSWQDCSLSFNHRGLLNQRASVGWLFFGGMTTAAATRSPGFDVQQAHALGSAAGFADGARIHADDFAVLADQHDFGVLGHLRDAHDLAVALGGPDVDHAGAAAALSGGIRRRGCACRSRFR